MAIIRHLSIRNFRGIKSLDWHLGSRIICLVGPGDSGKTTVLNAVELALLPRWNVPFTDADFYRAVTKEELVIEVTIGELPDALVKEDKYGLLLRGYSVQEQTIHDDADDGDDYVLTIRLSVDSDLEPQWTVVKETNPDPKSISWRDRELLAVAVVGEDVDRNLTWSRGSALARLTDAQSSARVIATANRKAREAVGDMELAEWQRVADQAMTTARNYGVPVNDLQPGLDVRAIRFGQGVLSLFDGPIPVQAFGLGSKRLATLAVQEAAVGKSSIILVDEVEHGLEPHRVRRLVKTLCEARTMGQVILTSHSPTPVVARPVEELRFARLSDGHLDMLACEPGARDALQGVIRRCPLAVFARSVIVCEGKTEEALCRVLDTAWATVHGGEGFDLRAVVAVDGGGRNAGPETARQLSRLGYRTMFLGDSDEPISPNEQELRAVGAEVLLWDGKMATEQRIAADVPLATLQALLRLGCEIKGEVSCLDSCRTQLQGVGGNRTAITGPVIAEWQQNGIEEALVRATIGNAAHASEWFKNLNDGRRLAEVVVAALPGIPGTPLATKLAALERWVYAR